MEHRRLLFINLIICTLIFATESSGRRSYNGFSSMESVQGEMIHYQTPEFELQQVGSAGQTFVRPVMKNSGTVVTPGQPFLPSTSTYYAVEPGTLFDVNVTVISSETIQNVDIVPLDGWDSEGAGDHIAADDPYGINELFPAEIVSVSNSIVFRELSLLQVTMTPFQYNPVTKELVIIHQADIELVENGSCELPFIPGRRSRAFESLYQSMVVNYGALDRTLTEYQRPSILYVLPSNIGNLLNTVQILMDWKYRVGYEVNYVSSSNVVNNKNNLKDYIENAYETWEHPPEYVTIVGDAEGSYDIPTWNESWSGYNGEGDHPYALLEGGDQYPEVFLGRISFDTQSDLQTQIGKLLHYESTPYMGENWFQRACLVGDPSTSGISCVITNEHIHEIMDLVGFEEINTIYNGSFASQMTAGISAGISFFNYRGYWGVSGFNSNNVNQTINGYMLPVATVITCGTGSFASGESLSEAFTRAGTVSNPKGAVVCIGTATLGTHTMFNNIVDMGFYYGAMIEEIESAGGALMYGKMMLHRNYPSNPNNYPNIFSHWNTLIGDASLQMWTAYPQPLNGDHTYAVTKGTNYIDIIINGENGGVENVWVTILMDDEIFESGYTNYEGEVRLPITSAEEGEVLLTATKRNHYPYQSSFQIYDPGVSVHINPELIIIDDDNDGASQGNNDGEANGGEIIELFAGITNYGSQNAANISGTLVSENPSVTILTAQAAYGSLLAGESAMADEPYIISLNNGLSEGADLHLSLNLEDSTGSSSNGVVLVDVAGNMIVAAEIDVVGEPEDVLTPGETSTVKIQLMNMGTTAAENIVGTITSPSPFIEILDGTGAWTEIPANGTMDNNNNAFVISALEETIPGATAYLMVNIETGSGYTSNSVLEIQIGTPTVYDPVGPDAYGYYIYDSGDINYVLSPSYNWVEVDSRYGGEGTYLSSLSDNGNNSDDVETINLPFMFTMYGLEYNQVSICSNGWISMGDTDMESFRNYQVPGVGGPSPMVAVFWDDLKLTNGGRVYTWYDNENHKFYIQWSRVRTYQNNSAENFQVILCDPDYYLTPTGDGEILIQYENFNNTSYGEYSWSQVHGDYCTVGIEDHTMTVGLQYTFNNTYHPAAMVLGDETALLITTRGSDIRLEGDLNVDNSMDVFDILLLIDHILGYVDHINPYLADINGDGMVNIMDMIRLIQRVMEW